MAPKKQPKGGGHWQKRYVLEINGAMSEYREAVEAAIAATNDATIMQRWETAKKGIATDFERTKPTFDAVRAEKVPSRSIKLIMLERADNFEAEVKMRLDQARKEVSTSSSQSKKGKNDTERTAEGATSQQELLSLAAEIREELIEEMQVMNRDYDVACARWQHESRILQSEYDQWLKAKTEYVTLGRIVAGTMLELLSSEVELQLKQMPGAKDDHTGTVKIEGWLTIPERILKNVERIMSNSAFIDEADLEGLQMEFQSAVTTIAQRTNETAEEYIMEWELLLEKGKTAYSHQFDIIFPESIRARYFINGCNAREIKDKIKGDAVRTGVLEYPSTFEEAKKMLMSYKQLVGRIRNPTSGAMYAVEVQKDTNKLERGKFKCYACGKMGHKQSDCKTGLTCYVCGKKGHLSYDCNTGAGSKNAENSGTGSRKARITKKATVDAAFIAAVSKDDVEEGWTTVKSKKTRRNSGTDLDEVILLDTGAEVSVFGNKKLLINVRETSETIKVRGIGEGTITSSTLGTYSPLGIDVYIMDGLKTNILSYGQAEEETGKKFRRTANGLGIVSKTGKMIEFKKVKRLFMHSSTKDVEKLVYASFRGQLPTEYYKGTMSKKDQERAKTARTLMENMSISKHEFKEMVKENGLRSLNLEAKDIDNAVNLYGEDPNYVKGRMVARNNAKMVVPEEAKSRDTSLWLDIMFFWDLPFLVGVTDYKLVIAASIQNKSKREITRGVWEMKKLLGARNQHIRTVFMDNEAGARVSNFLDIGMVLKKVSRRTKVGKVDVMIREIKRRVRSQAAACRHMLPRAWTKYMVKCAVGQMNLLVRNIEGVKMTPREHLMGTKADVKNFKIKFGDLCEVHTGKIDNSIGSRTTPCIALEPTMSDDYSWRFYDTETKSIRQSCSYVKVPMTEDMRKKLSKITADKVSALSIDDRIIIEDDNVAKEDEVRGEARNDEVQGETNETSVDEDVEEKLLSENNMENNTIEENEEEVADVYRISYKKAKADHKELAIEAAMKEIRDLINQGTFDPAPYSSKTDLPAFMFFKEKFDANGVFVKLKARLVALGNRVSDQIYADEDISSATPMWQHIMAILAIVAKERLHSKVIDIPFSYLWADNHMGHIMMCDKTITEIIIKVKPDWVQFVQNGKIKVKIIKSLYGLKESAKLWNDHIKKDLIEYGFAENPMDCCVFNKNTDKGVLTLVLYVDDLHISCASKEEIDHFVDFIKSKYGNIAESEYDKYSYLGTFVDTSYGDVRLSCKKYIDDVLKNHFDEKTMKKCVTPATDDLFEFDDENDTKLDKNEADEYHSIVAKLLYISTRIRIDILLAVSYLATKVSSPTTRDREKLNRILGYIKSRPYIEVRLNGDKLPNIEAYVDASYGTHMNKKSHTGIYVTLGEGPIIVKSVKQKIVSKSSTEAELNGLSLSLSVIMELKMFLFYQGLDVGQIIIYQDNQSVMKMVNHGRATSDNTRHIEISKFFVKQYIDNGEIKLQYKPTEEMTADTLTKPLQGKMYKDMFNRLNLYVSDSVNEKIVAITMKGCVEGSIGLGAGWSNRGVRKSANNCKTHTWSDIVRKNSVADCRDCIGHRQGDSRYITKRK